MARNCTDGDAVRNSQPIGTVTGPFGGEAVSGVFSERRTSGGTGSESGTGGGDIEGGGITILQLYLSAVVPLEGRDERRRFGDDSSYSDRRA